MTFFGKWFGDDEQFDSNEGMVTSPPPIQTGQLVAGTVGRSYAPGDLIADRYEVVKVLVGGMGIVYLCADHTEDRRPVALKTFKPKYVPDRAARDRFLREGTIWVRLGYHPNIVRAHRVERLSGRLEVYLVLEWVAQAEGQDDASLRAWLRAKKPLPLNQALLFALHIARGMNYAVDRIPGLVHRDLKPENVLVGQDGLAQVTDFGLASILASLKTGMWKTNSGNSDLRRTHFGNGAVGTPLYMAPEQWQRDVVLDMRADIYAFGCILFEMLTGQRAVSGKSLQDLARAHQTGRVAELPPELPSGVKALVKGCLATQLDKRFQSWTDVEKAVTLVYQRVLKQDAPRIGKRQERDDRVERIAAGWSYDAMGLSYHDIGHHDLAAGYFERVIWIARQEGDHAMEGAGLNHLGKTCLEMGDVQGAIEFHEQHLIIARQIDDQGGESDSLGNLGQAYSKLGDTKRALAYYEEQLALVQAIGDQVREGQALCNLGDLSQRTGDIREAMQAYKQALTIVRQTEDRLREGRILGHIGLIFAKKDEMERAIQFYEQALDIARKMGDRTGEGTILGRLGNVHRKKGDDQRALWFLVNCLSIKQETRDRLGEGQILYDLGNVYLDAGDTYQAIEAYQAALIIAKKVGNHFWAGQILSRLGDAYHALDEPWRAIGFYQEGLALVKEAGDSPEVGNFLYRLGNIYGITGDFWQARQCYEEALALPDSIMDASLEAKIKLDFAILLAVDNELKKGLDYAQEAVKTFKQLGNAQRVKLAKETISGIRRRRRWF